MADAERSGELEPGEIVQFFGEEQRGALALGIRSRARWRSPDRRMSITVCSADGAAPRDSPVHGRNRMILRRRISSSATRWAIW